MQSLWTQSVEDQQQRYPSLDHDITTQIAIVGGGLTGILCARLLTDAGVDCVVVDQGRIGHGATGFTTAKVSVQHGLLYADLIEKKGESDAWLFYRAQTEALRQIEAMAQGLPCDYRRVPAYVYARENTDELEREAKAYESLGITYSLEDSTPLPFPVKGALGIPDQGEFNPMAFMHALLPGLTIYENTMVTDVKHNRAITPQGTITADRIVLATRYPVINVPGWYFLKLNQYRSYIVALKGAPEVKGMYIDADSTGFSFRNHREYLLVGGGGHKTGEAGGQYGALREFTRQAYPEATDYLAWATQDSMSLDSLPYIGIHRKSARHLLVASGYSKWGMTSAMLAATTLRDMIVRGKSPYTELLSPQRSKSASAVIGRGVSSVKGMLKPTTKRCSHLGCGLTHNTQEGSWDCLCHGSRFGNDGEVLDNPAKKGIQIG